APGYVTHRRAHRCRYPLANQLICAAPVRDAKPPGASAKLKSPSDIERLAVRYTERRFRRLDRRRFIAWVEVDAWHGGPGAGRGLRPTFRDLRLRRVGEPRKRFEREHATLSLGRAAAELAQRDGHVASEHVCAGVGLDD